MVCCSIYLRHLCALRFDKLIVSTTLQMIWLISNTSEHLFFEHGMPLTQHQRTVVEIITCNSIVQAINWLMRQYGFKRNFIEQYLDLIWFDFTHRMWIHMICIIFLCVMFSQSISCMLPFVYYWIVSHYFTKFAQAKRWNYIVSKEYRENVSILFAALNSSCSQSTNIMSIACNFQ